VLVTVNRHKTDVGRERQRRKRERGIAKEDCLREQGEGEEEVTEKTMSNSTANEFSSSGSNAMVKEAE
jgi:hypothetical protein